MKSSKQCQKEIDEEVRKRLLQQLKDEEQFNDGFNRAHDYEENKGV